MQMILTLVLLLFAESLFYLHTTVEKMATGQVHMTRAEVTGSVQMVRHERGDGDWHIRVSDGKYFIVAECMPQIPCTVPKVGDKISVRGITRYDYEHHWQEIHPVLGLEVVK
jgi:hypothetical protein